MKNEMRVISSEIKLMFRSLDYVKDSTNSKMIDIIEKDVNSNTEQPLPGLGPGTRPSFCLQ